MEQVRIGERAETVTYFEDALGRPPGRSQDPLTDGVKAGTTLVGSPETVARGIEKLLEASGGFGGFLFRAHDWADREQTWRSYELFARWVMPRFQHSLDTVRASHEWAVENRGPSSARMWKRCERPSWITGRRCGGLRRPRLRRAGHHAGSGRIDVQAARDTSVHTSTERGIARPEESSHRASLESSKP
jgi:hypothetical protein